MESNYPVFTAEQSQVFRKQGFPQPPLKKGQFWYSLLDHCHEIIEDCGGGTFKSKVLYSGHEFTFEYISQGSAYCPTFEEALEWVKNYGTK